MKDGQAFITAKKARIARAGTQIYSALELEAMSGITLDGGKEFGTVYRPPEVVIKNKDKFANAPFVNDHTLTDVTPDNWKEHAIGFVSGDIDVEVFDNDIWIVGDVVFYDRKAYEDYKNGKVELSAGYDVKLAKVNNPDVVGYDVVMVDIPAVNHVALCECARAGHNARVLDSLKIIESQIGGSEMDKIKSGFLSLFGIGKSKDEGFKFSKVLMDSVSKMHTLKGDELTKEVMGVTQHIASLGDTEERALLAGAVTDCFKHPAEVLKKCDEISAKIDELYAKCQDADAAVISRILKTEKVEDAAAKKLEETKPAEDSKGISTLVEDAVTKALSSLTDSIDKKIDAAVKKTLGIEVTEKGKDDRPAETFLLDSSGIDKDASYLTRGIWGNR